MSCHTLSLPSSLPIKITRAHARWVFDRGAARGDAGFVPRLGLFGIFHREADRAAVSDRRGFAVDRRADEEQPAVVHIDQASLVVDDRRFAADRLKGGVIEFLRCLKVVRSDHIVTVHGFSAPPDSGCESIPTLPFRSGPAAIMFAIPRK